MFRFAALILALSVAAGCQAASGPSRSSSSDAARAEVDLDLSTPRSTGELFTATARQAPGGFGGVFFTEEEEVLNVVMKDTMQRAAALAAVEALKGRYPETGAYLTGLGLPGARFDVRIVQGRYSYAELKQYRDKAATLFSRFGMTMLDIDVKKSQISIGVKPGTATKPIQEELSLLGVPRGAVRFEEVTVSYH